VRPSLPPDTRPASVTLKLITVEHSVRLTEMDSGSEDELNVLSGSDDHGREQVIELGPPQRALETDTLGATEAATLGMGAAAADTDADGLDSDDDALMSSPINSAKGGTSAAVAIASASTAAAAGSAGDSDSNGDYDFRAPPRSEGASESRSHTTNIDSHNQQRMRQLEQQKQQQQKQQQHASTAPVPVMRRSASPPTTDRAMGARSADLASHGQAQGWGDGGGGDEKDGSDYETDTDESTGNDNGSGNDGVYGDADDGYGDDDFENAPPADRQVNIPSSSPRLLRLLLVLLLPLLTILSLLISGHRSLVVNTISATWPPR